MNLNALRAFYTAAVHGSFTKAAAALGVTQPALTAHVRGLERHYGVELFVRTPRGVELASRGRGVFSVAEEIFAREAIAEAVLSGEEGALSGVLRIGADNPYNLMPRLKAFLQAHPAVKVEASFGNTRAMIDALERLLVDVALVAAPSPDPRLVTKAVGSEPLMIVVNRDHQWGRKRTTGLAALHGASMIRREEGSRTQEELDRACAAAGVQPQSTLQVQGREALREAIAHGFGPGVIARGELGEDARLHAIAIRDVRVRLEERVVCLAARRASPMIDAFLAMVARGSSKT